MKKVLLFFAFFLNLHFAAAQPHLMPVNSVYEINVLEKGKFYDHIQYIGLVTEVPLYSHEEKTYSSFGAWKGAKETLAFKGMYPYTFTSYTHEVSDILNILSMMSDYNGILLMTSEWEPTEFLILFRDRDQSSEFWSCL